MRVDDHDVVSDSDPEQRVQLESLLLRGATGEVICAITTDSRVGTLTGWRKTDSTGHVDENWDYSSLGGPARVDLGARLTDIAGHPVTLG